MSATVLVASSAERVWVV